MHKKEMPFLEHLEELRWHIIRSLIGVLIISIIAFLAKNIVFDYIVFGPKHIEFITYQILCRLAGMLSADALCIKEINFTVTNIDMAGQFLIHMKISFIMGLIVGFPYVFWEIWRFVVPALNTNEKKYSGGVIIYTSFLFYLGIAFGYYVLAPFSINFLGTYSVSEEIHNTINLSSYISTLTMMVLASGLIFEMPVVIYFLAKIGILSPEFMKTYRRHAIIVILFVSAIITPPDVTSQVIIAIPLYFLYEIGIFIARRVYKPV